MRLMCIISFPVAASNSTGMNPCGSCVGAAALGCPAAGEAPADTRCGAAEVHAESTNKRSEKRFMSVFLSPREKAHQKAEVTAIGGGVRQSAIGCDFEHVLCRTGRDFVLAHQMGLSRFEAIDHRAIQQKRDRRRRRYQLVRHIELNAQLGDSDASRQDCRRAAGHPSEFFRSIALWRIPPA